MSLQISGYKAYSTVMPAQKQQTAIPQTRMEGKAVSAPTAQNHMEDLVQAFGEKKLKAIGMIECTTCAERRYVDGSNDAGVSFKTPGKISPEASAAVVMGHEMEHVSNEKASAIAESREIVSQSVTLQTSLCPECGKSYVAGGTTRTTTKSVPEYEPSKELLKGAKMDAKG